MDIEDILLGFVGQNIVLLLLAALIIISVLLGVRIVPQSMKFVVERFGRLRSVLGPGINFIVPFLDRVAHRISILERQLPTHSQDAITADNVLVQVDTSVFYRITEPEKTVYRIRDVDAAISTTVTGIVRAQIGKMELDEVQSNRSELIMRIKEQVEDRRGRLGDRGDARRDPRRQSGSGDPRCDAAAVERRARAPRGSDPRRGSRSGRSS